MHVLDAKQDAILEKIFRPTFSVEGKKMGVWYLVVPVSPRFESGVAVNCEARGANRIFIDCLYL